ncbi:MAG: hypothetical protein M3R32_03950 [Chloroflexota bacterium]|nr:hypothetical protein [Chloroflexota bacterium]
MTLRPSRRLPRRRALLISTLGTGVLAAASLLAGATVAVGATPTAAPTTAPHSGKVPVFAYYYIWFTPASWERAKIDLPLLGKYTSDDPAVIAKHVEWAKSAGIDGFIVSWKHQPRLDRPLQLLVQEAEKRNFKLILLYQGLDVDRNPIDPNQVSTDIQWFSQNYGSNPVFNVFGKPAVVWSGTWKFTDQQIATVRSQIDAPNKLLLLGSERSNVDYQARASVLDGDAYYWSSADPLNTPGYPRRIEDLGAAIAADHGLWIAPIVPGFDARLLGGTTVVDRRGGATYRASWKAASDTQPSVLGIISWNEFSENSHIEPSSSNALFYLDATRSLIGATPEPAPSATPGKSVDPGSLGPGDSSELPPAQSGIEEKLSLAAGIALLVGLTVIMLRMRRRSARDMGE